MRFDVYPLPSGGAGYIVDVQSDFLEHLPTRVVVPLISAGTFKTPIREVHPVFEIANARFVLMTHELASIRKLQLHRPVASLAAYREQITRALDILFTGF
jgi:toxin CcdB